MLSCLGNFLQTKLTESHRSILLKWQNLAVPVMCAHTRLFVYKHELNTRVFFLNFIELKIVLNIYCFDETEEDDSYRF